MANGESETTYVKKALFSSARHRFGCFLCELILVRRATPNFYYILLHEEEILFSHSTYIHTLYISHLLLTSQKIGPALIHTPSNQLLKRKYANNSSKEMGLNSSDREGIFNNVGWEVVCWWSKDWIPRTGLRDNRKNGMDLWIMFFWISNKLRESS